MSKRVLAYLYWRIILRNPRLRSLITRLVVREEERELTLFGAPVAAHSRKEIGYFRAEASASRNAVFRDEAASILNLALLLSPGDTFVDIGANVGLYTSTLSKAVEAIPDLRFYAIDANPDTFARLQRTVGAKPVVLLNHALSDREGSLEFVSGATSGVFGPKVSATHFTSARVTMSVRAVLLDSLSIDGDSIVIKIDVEGHERQVIDGGQELLRSGRVKAVYLDGFADRSIPGHLETLGFRLLDGRTMAPTTSAAADHSLLAVSRSAFSDRH